MTKAELISLQTELAAMRETRINVLARNIVGLTPEERVDSDLHASLVEDRFWALLERYNAAIKAYAASTMPSPTSERP